MGAYDAVGGTAHFGQLQYHHRENDARHARYADKRDALGDDLGENIARRCPDGAPYSYLGGAFFHRHHHDVAHADGPCQQRADAYKPRQEVYSVEQIVHHTEECFHIKGRQGLFVGRVYMVCTCQHRAYLGYNLAHLVTLMGRKTQQVDGVAHSKSVSHHVYRHNNRLLCITINVEFPRTIIHAYHLKEHRTYTDFLAARVSALREK